MAGGPPPSGPLPGLQLRYTAGALLPELKQLAAPATLDSSPLDMGVEDHATHAPLAVRKTDQALGLLEDVLAIELLLASDVLATAGDRPVLGAGGIAALQTVEASRAAAGEPTPEAVHRALRARFPAPRGPLLSPTAPTQEPYALALEDVEVERYRAMAEQARAGGRRPRLNPAQAAHARQLYDGGQHTVQQIADLLGVPRGTLYGHLDTVTINSRRRSQHRE